MLRALACYVMYVCFAMHVCGVANGASDKQLAGRMILHKVFASPCPRTPAISPASRPGQTLSARRLPLPKDRSVQAHA